MLEVDANSSAFEGSKGLLADGFSKAGEMEAEDKPADGTAKEELNLLLVLLLLSKIGNCRTMELEGRTACWGLNCLPEPIKSLSPYNDTRAQCGKEHTEYSETPPLNTGINQLCLMAAHSKGFKQSKKRLTLQRVSSNTCTELTPVQCCLRTSFFKLNILIYQSNILFGVQ